MSCFFQPSAVNKTQFKRVSSYFEKNTQDVLSKFSMCECTSNFSSVNPNCNGYMYCTVGDVELKDFVDKDLPCRML